MLFRKEQVLYHTVSVRNLTVVDDKKKKSLKWIKQKRNSVAVKRKS